MIKQPQLQTPTLKKMSRRQFLFALGLSLAAVTDVVAIVIHNFQSGQPKAKPLDPIAKTGFGSKAYGSGTYGR
jgi:HAMP domain-containing protein